MSGNLRLVSISLVSCLVAPALAQQKPGVTPNTDAVGHFTEPLGSIRLDAPIDGDNGNNRVPDPRRPLDLLSGFDDIIVGNTVMDLESRIFDIDVHDPRPAFRPLSPIGDSGYSISNGPIPAAPTTLPLLMLSGLVVCRGRR